MEEDYKEKYNVALEKARKELATCGSLDCDAARQIFRLFPQLRESKDERIREELIGHCKDLVRMNRDDKVMLSIYKPWLAWLEKQKESLHVPEMCKENGKSFTDEDEKIRKKCIELIKRTIPSGNSASSESIEIVECINWLENQKEQKPKFYPGDVIKCTSGGSLWVRCKGGDNIRSDGHTACIGGGFELASEEEAVQFFQELNENGYQWDCIKGRPMKKEQKPVSYTPLCNTIKDKIREYVSNHFVTDTVVTTDVKSIVKAMEEGVKLGKESQKPVEWSKEDESQLDDIEKAISNYYDLNHAPQYHYWLEQKLKSLRSQPKQEWSDVEMKLLESIIDDYEKAAKSFCGYDGKIMFLKAIRDGECDLSKQEWSEEDDKMLQSIIDDFRKGHVSSIGQDQWLKSLRPQQKKELNFSGFVGKIGSWFANLTLDRYRETFDGDVYPATLLVQKYDSFVNKLSEEYNEKALHWKPSEEQMDSLHDTIVRTKGYSYSTYLPELYEQLKKLM